MVMHFFYVILYTMSTLDLLLIILIVLLSYHLWISKETVDIPMIEDVLLPVTGGKFVQDRDPVRVMDPAHVLDPEWQKTGVSVGSETVSRGIASTTPQKIYGQMFAGLWN